jgi:uncharacterized membrane protein YsdA (DUF1294 family)/cold shock CspA family protein
MGDLEEKGRLVLWNDDKGFGFVRPETRGEKDLFLHISAIKNYRKGLSRRPAQGDGVRYEALSAAEAAGKRRISRAMVEGINAQAFGADPNPASRLTFWLHKALASVPIFLSFYVIWRAGNPLPLVSYIFMSALAILYYAGDKQRSLTHSWRVPESYLHGFEFMGGWPGALLAQDAFRHKNKKGRYQRIFWTIVAAHGLMWGAYFYHDLNGGW